MSRFWCRACGAPAPNEPKGLIANPGPCPNCGTNCWETELDEGELARVNWEWRNEQFGRERDAC